MKCFIEAINNVEDLLDIDGLNFGNVYDCSCQLWFTPLHQRWYFWDTI